MKFTQQGKKVNNQIQNYLSTVVAIIRKEIPEARSILLGGGFGRGEGSVEIKDGKVIPQNDFEIFLITKKAIREKRINETANKAVRSLDLDRVGADFYNFERECFADTFYIDMKVLPLKKLPYLLPMFRYYELKNSSCLLWGKDYRHLMPDFAVQDLPLTEGLRLLFNRMALLCLYFSFDYLEEMSPHEKHGLLYLGSKAWTDLAGALTLLNGTYKPTYRERLKEFQKNFSRDFPKLGEKAPELPKIVKRGLDFKLHPDFSKDIDPYKLWEEEKKYIKIVTLYLAEKFFQKNFKNIFELADFLYKEGWKHYHHPYLNYLVEEKSDVTLDGHWVALPLIPILNVLYFLRVLKFKRRFHPRILLNPRTPDLTMFAAMLYILYGTEGKRKINKEKLAKAKFYLRKTYPISKPESSNPISQWEVLKNDFSNAFLLFSLMKIV